MTGESFRERIKVKLESFSRRALALGHKLEAKYSPRRGQGLDSTHLLPEQDELNRYRIAEELFRLLTEQPENWAARVALLGEWGSGKTVIATWVEKLASDNDHCVVWFNPWSAISVGQMWFELSYTLHRKLKERGIELSIGREFAHLVRAAYYDFGAANETPYLKDYVSLIERFLRLSDEDIIAIRDALGSRRVILIIDDLDRADNILIPKLLLAMRELFDLPGFSFLVPFDKPKVVRALQLSPHYLEGHDFLEKIFDYQVQIPPPTTEQKLSLFGNTVRDVLSTMPPGVERELANVLPDNPRRLKRIALQFQVAKRQIERHSPQEIDWQSLLYAALLRSENDVFFERYVKDAFFGDRRLDEAIGGSSDNRRNKSSERIEALLEECVSDSNERERLRLIAEEWENKRGYWTNSAIVYTIQLFDRPHAFTWREFDDILALWRERFDVDLVIDSLKTVAGRSRITSDKVIYEFIDSITGRYHDLLEKAAGAFRAEEQAKLADEAGVVLSLARALGVHSSFSDALQRAHLFERLAGAIAPWAHFCGNDADARLRAREEAVLGELARQAGEEWYRYDAILEHRDDDELPSIKSFNAVKSRLKPIFADRELALLESAFTKERGLRELLAYNSLAGPCELFLDPSSRAWVPLDDAPIPNVLRKAAQTPLVQQNAFWFLRTVRADDYFGLRFGQKQAKALLQGDGVAALLWNAAVATPLQYRFLLESRGIYKMLCDLGIDSAKLRFAEWLNAGRREGE
jgi:hypothetical protein